MGMLLTLAMPILTAIAFYLQGKTGDIAQKTGLSEDAVGKVSAAVTGLLTGDNQAAQTVMAEIDRARAHDVATNTNMPPIVNLLRGLVRPVITLTAFFWYVYARSTGIAVTGEDYAMVGGIVAFWFGFRPFEKQGMQAGLLGALAQRVATMPDNRGKAATGGVAE